MHTSKLSTIGALVSIRAKLQKLVSLLLRTMAKFQNGAHASTAIISFQAFPQHLPPLHPWQTPPTFFIPLRLGFLAPTRRLKIRTNSNAHDLIISRKRTRNDSGAFMCARWWIQGECFCNCNNKASHVGANAVPKVKRNEFSPYIAKVCRENSPPLTSA